MIALPIISIVLNYIPVETLNLSNFEQIFGVLYKDLKINEKGNMFYILIFILRRINIAVISLYLSNYPAIQI